MEAFSNNLASCVCLLRDAISTGPVLASLDLLLLHQPELSVGAIEPDCDLDMFREPAPVMRCGIGPASSWHGVAYGAVRLCAQAIDAAGGLQALQKMKPARLRKLITLNGRLTVDDLDYFEAAILHEREDTAEQIRKWREQQQQKATGRVPQPEPAITLLDGQRCGVGRDVKPVTESEYAVLETLFDLQAKGEYASIAVLADRSGYAKPNEILGRLRTKYGGQFAPYIFFPGGPRNGGYAAKIVDRRSKVTFREVSGNDS